VTELVDNLLADLYERPKPVYIQRTELGRYAECPHQAHLCEVHKNEIETHDVLPEAGRIVHAIAKEAIEWADRDLQAAADYFAEELPKALERPDLQPEVLRAGKHLANELRRYSANAVLLAEETVTRCLFPATGDRGDVLIVCVPDLVLATRKQDLIVVLDYKTGWLERTKQQALDDFQTCVGTWCLWGKYPDVERVRWIYLNTRRHTQTDVWLERHEVIGPNDLTQEQAFEARIAETVQIWQSGRDDAWPEPGKCAICPVLRWCELCNSEPAEFAKDPKGYVDSYVALSARLKQMEETFSNATRDGRRIYGTKCYFDDMPKRKSPRRISLKEMQDETE